MEQPAPHRAAHHHRVILGCRVAAVFVSTVALLAAVGLLRSASVPVFVGLLPLLVAVGPVWVLGVYAHYLTRCLRWQALQRPPSL
jgi:hypothetical protein